MTLKQESKPNDLKSSKAAEETDKELSAYLGKLKGKSRDMALDEWLLFQNAKNLCDKSIQKLNWVKDLLNKNTLPLYLSDVGYDELIVLASVLRSINTLKELRAKYERRKSKSRRVRSTSTPQC